MNKRTATIWENRRELSNAIQAIGTYPQMIEYGHQYSITLLGPTGEAVTAVFSYNRHTYASVGDTNAVGVLVPQLVPEANYAELSSYALTSLIDCGAEQSINPIRHDNGHFFIPGSEIRYRVEGMRNGTWKHLTDDYSMTINPIRPWFDPEVDKKNESMIREWVKDTQGKLARATENIEAIAKEIGPAQ